MSQPTFSPGGATLAGAPRVSAPFDSTPPAGAGDLAQAGLLARATPPQGLDPSPPPGLPDVATLARLAGAFLAELPGGTARGGVPVPANPHPAGLAGPPGLAGPATLGALPGLPPLPGANLVPSSPQAPANALASTPALLPHAVAPNGVPDLALTAGPALDGRLGGPLLGAPPSAASAVPALPAVPVVSAVPSTHATHATHATSAPALAASPFYFLRDPSPAPFGNVAPQGFAAPAGFSLPGDPAANGRPGIPPVATGAHPPFDVHAVRRDFPILRERVHGRPLVWFDNAATTQKPQAVIDRVSHFYEHENSNIHRAAHELAARATDAYEDARETVRRFINASSTEEVVFVRGATEAINLVAKSWGVQHIRAGDEIVVSHLEHHANIVPWQQLAAQVGAHLRVIPVDDDGQVLLDAYQALLSDRTRLVAVTQVSNALGTVVPVRQIVELAHRAGAKALVDAAQSVSHLAVDVQALGADFLVFSGHKVFGPTGIGVLYGRREVLEDMPPWQGGGNMIADVTFERTVYQPPPNKFEAGTGNIADAVGLGAALRYVERLGIEQIGRYEHQLLHYATERLRPIPGVRLVGTARDKASVLSFVLAGHSTDEVGQALNREGIAVRTGHHCAQPILRRFGLEATVRPSLAFYNTCEEVDRFIEVVWQLSGARRR